MKITVRKLARWCFMLLFFVSFFCPYYSYTTNKMTITFSLSCCCALICCCIMSKIRGKNRKIYFWYSYILLIYTVIFLVTNVIYINCYWEMINRVICFGFFLCLVRKGKNAFGEASIERGILLISWLAIVFSIILYLFNIEELSFAGGINYRIQGQHFTDKRLTYVFTHKSGYGLILFLLLFLAVNNSAIFKSKRHYRIYIATVMIGILLSGSASTWLSAIFMFVILLVGKLKKRINKNIFIIVFTLALLSPYLLYNIYTYLLANRNLSTGGSRFLIWEIAFDYLSTHFIGLGDLFYSTIINGVNNFHNVFLNEMLHFSILVGVIYFLLLTMIILMSYGFHKYNFTQWLAFWVPVLLLLMIDQSLTVSSMPLFLSLVYIVMFHSRNELIESHNERIEERG